MLYSGLNKVVETISRQNAAINMKTLEKQYSKLHQRSKNQN